MSAVFIVCLSTFFLFISVSIAPAKEAGPFYVGLFGGYVMPNDLEITGGLFEDDRDVSLDNSWMIGAKFGYIFPSVKWLAVELEYYYLADQDIDEPGATGNFSASNLMANLIFRWPEGKFHPYVGFGLGWSWGSFEEAAYEESDNTLAWQLLVGVTYEITPQWSAELGYKYFSCEYDVGAFAQAEATDHIFLVGVNYHF
jgi:opacity protein-like surface antigen